MRRPLLDGASPGPHRRTTALQDSLHRDLRGRLGTQRVGSPPPDPEHAIRQLTGSSSSLMLDKGDTLRPFEADKVQILKGQGEPRPLLPWHAQVAFEYAAAPLSRMLRTEEDLVSSPDYSLLYAKAY